MVRQDIIHGRQICRLFGQHSLGNAEKSRNEGENGMRKYKGKRPRRGTRAENNPKGSVMHRIDLVDRSDANVASCRSGLLVVGQLAVEHAQQIQHLFVKVLLCGIVLDHVTEHAKALDLGNHLLVPCQRVAAF